MQVRLHILLLLLLCSVGAAASPDSIRRFEVFIDTDPGIGAGTQYTIVTQRDTVSGAYTVPIPGGIAPGKHYLYIRSFADSFGYRGRWSQIQRRAFYIKDKVVAAEYFYDTDPGVGAGVALTVLNPADTVSLSASISTTGLSIGKHRVYVRSRTSTGRWSLAQGRDFYIKGSVTATEYFYDTDPGAGLGTTLSVTTPGDTVSQSYVLSTPSSMAAGKHALYIRTRSDGKWSIPAKREFYVLPSITAAEYFFDNDPGVGNGTALAVTTDDTIAQNYTIPTSGLGGGMHRMYIRTRSANRNWSIAGAREFFVKAKVVAAEYFWDNDPGTGNGVPLSISVQADTISQAYNIKAPCLAPGDHHLYVRSKDEFGRWGITQEDTVTFALPTIAATATEPGTGPYGTPVKVTGSGGNPPYHYAYLPNAATADSIFLTPNNTSATYTATDTCGYTATTTITTPAAPIIIAGGNTGTGSVILNGWRHWVYINDARGNIIGAVRDYGQSLGTVTMSFSKNNSGTVRQFANGQHYLDRNFVVTATGPVTGSAGVMLFAVDTEYNALAAADLLLTSKSQLRINKYDGPNEDLDYSNNAGGQYLIITPDSVVSYNGPTNAGNGYVLAFAVTSFSEFFESRGSGIALPLRDVTLSASKAGNAVRLDWHTEGEHGTVEHQLLRSSTGSNIMSPIAKMKPKSGLTADYSYVDEHPLNGINYYRVQVGDAAGKSYYSQTVTIKMNGTQMITIYPNPAHNKVTVGGTDAGDQIRLRDMTGRVVWNAVATGREVLISTADFSQGLYTLDVVNAYGNHSVQSIEIIH